MKRLLFTLLLISGVNLVVELLENDIKIAFAEGSGIGYAMAYNTNTNISLKEWCLIRIKNDTNMPFSDAEAKKLAFNSCVNYSIKKGS